MGVSIARRNSADAALLTAIYESSQDGLIVADRLGSITRFSPAAEAMFGFSAEEVVGHNISMLMPAEMADVHTGHMANYDPDNGFGVMIQNPEVVAVKKCGIEFPVDINVRSIAVGREVVYAATVRDITVHKQAEKVQLQALEEIEDSLQKQITLNESQRQFVAMASHEFRTPLAIIDSAAQRIVRRKDNLTPEHIFDHAERVRGSVQRMTDLVERMLSSERINAGDIAIRVGDYNLREIIKSAADRQHEISKFHTITCDLDGLPDTIRCDERALEQVFNNLISNAAKYSPDNSDLTVRSLMDGENVVISVEDHGLGIAEEDLPKMFQRYFRAGTSAGIVGTGIGLNLSKMLVESHGGVISVHSEKGKGSVFTVRLPIAGPMEKEIIQEQAA